MRIKTTALMILALILFALGIGRASDRDETVVTVQVTSSYHELQEGYFSLGESATLIARPGTDLHRFLSRQVGRNVRIVLTAADGHELSELHR